MPSDQEVAPIVYVVAEGTASCRPPLVGTACPDSLASMIRDCVMIPDLGSLVLVEDLQPLQGPPAGA